MAGMACRGVRTSAPGNSGEDRNALRLGPRGGKAPPSPPREDGSSAGNSPKAIIGVTSGNGCFAFKNVSTGVGRKMTLCQSSGLRKEEAALSALSGLLPS